MEKQGRKNDEWIFPHDNFEPYSTQQLWYLGLASRIAASVGFVSSLLLFRLAFRQRHRMYHRFMMALAAYTSLFALCHLYGPAAIPHDVPHAPPGSAGTVATCTAQGFLLQLSMAAPLYYAIALSGYSSRVVRIHFHVAQYAWMEKYIHFGIHVFPLVSALYLWQQEAFHYGGNAAVCWISAAPLYDCATNHTHVKEQCQRGPENIDLLALLLGWLPSLILLLVPTVTTMVLIWQVQTRQTYIRLRAGIVARQAALYLLAMWWSALISIISNAMKWLTNTNVQYAQSIVAVINLNLWSLWVLLIYSYFRIPESTHRIASSASTSFRLSAAMTPSHTVPDEDDNDDTLHPTKTHAPLSLEPIHSHTMDSRHSLNVDDTETDAAMNFDIFDGSNADGDFADFIYEGDSEDIRRDQEETEQWATIQGHV